MVGLLLHKNPDIQNLAMNGISEIFFPSNIRITEQERNLLQLVETCRGCEDLCLEKYLTAVFLDSILPTELVTKIWQRYCDDIKYINKDEAYTALKIIRICGSYSSGVLTNQMEILQENTLKELRSPTCHFLLVKEGLTIWMKHSSDYESAFSDEVSFLFTKHLGTKNQTWIVCVETFIDGLFDSNNLKKICEEENKADAHNLFNIKSEVVKPRKTRSKNSRIYAYKIAEKFMFNLLGELKLDASEVEEETSDSLSHVLFVIGHTALGVSKFTDQIQSIMEAKTDQRKRERIANRGNYEEEEIDYDADGDDEELESDKSFLDNALENLVTGDSIVAKYLPLLDIILESVIEKYRGFGPGQDQGLTLLENMALVTFCKFMVISKTYCKKHLNIFFKLLTLENLNPHNLLVCIKDLYRKFPLLLDKYEHKFFSVLDHKRAEVRKEGLIVISHLTLTDMIRIKQCFVEICKLLLDEELEIRCIVHTFLTKLHEKGSSRFLYIFKLTYKTWQLYRQ